MVVWQGLPKNTLEKIEYPLSVHPTLHPTRNGKSFVKKFLKLVENLLGIDLSERWDSDDYQAALGYLESNQLFWDCLQVASVEDRGAVENIIMKAPKE